MDKQQAQLEDIHHIKKMMERSSRYSALSGLSGVLVGFFALLSVAISYAILGISPFKTDSYLSVLSPTGVLDKDLLKILALNFGIVLILSFTTALWLSGKNATKKGQQRWDLSAKRMLFNFMIPMIAGGIYCLILFMQNHIELLIPATILFYGLALLNASKYTVDDIKYLGILLVLLGLLASTFFNQALIFWAIGFGLLHIIYGTSMYFKYEK